MYAVYVVLTPQPNGRWTARVYPEGKINNVGEFTQFLQAGLNTDAK